MRQLHTSTRLSIFLITTILIVLIAGSIFFAYLKTTTMYNEELPEGASIFYQLSPPIAPSSDTLLEFRWHVEGMSAVYFDDSSVIGDDFRTIEVCKSLKTYKLSVELKNGDTITRSIQPSILLFNNVFIGFCVLVSISSFILLKMLFPLNNLHYLAFLFLYVSISLFVLLFYPTCQNSQLIDTLSSHLGHTFTYIITMLSSFFTTIMLLLNRKLAQRIISKICSSIPFSIMVGIVTLIWMILYPLVRWQSQNNPKLFLFFAIPIFLYGMGILILYAIQPIEHQPPKKILFHLPKSNRAIFNCFIILLWIAIYNLDWVILVQNVPVQATIGFLLFILPGILFYSLIFRSGSLTVDGLLYGFLIAFLIITCLTIFGIVLGLSIKFLILTYSIMSSVPLIKILYKHQIFSIMLTYRYPDLSKIIFIVAFITVMFLTIATKNHNSDRLNAPDDYTYHGIVTGYVSANPLEFEDVFLGTEFDIRNRFWFRFWPSAQAFIVHLSDASILQIEFVLSLQLSIIAMVAVYYLAIQLGLSRSLALIATIAHVSLLSSQIFHHSSIGTQFYLRITQDKHLVSFVLTPIVLGSVIQYLEKRSVKHFALVIISIMAISFTHPTATAIAALIIGIYLFIYWLRNLSSIVVIALIITVFIVGMLPSIVIKLTDSVVYFTETKVDDLERLSRLGNRIAFDDNNKIIGIISNLRSGFSFSFLAAMFILGIPYFWRDNVARYLFSTCLAIIFASHPLTSPILAKLITLSHISRVMWFAPFGIALAFLLHILFYFMKRFKLPILPLHNWTITITALIVLIYMIFNLLFTGSKNHNYQSFSNYLVISQADYIDWLIELESWLDTNANDGDVVITSTTTLQEFVPVIARNIYPIAFRSLNQTTMPNSLYQQRFEDHLTFVNAIKLNDTKNFIDIIKKYQVNWMIIDSQNITNNNIDVLFNMKESIELDLEHIIGDIYIYKVCSSMCRD